MYSHPLFRRDRKDDVFKMGKKLPKRYSALLSASGANSPEPVNNSGTIIIAPFGIKRIPSWCK
jgi:hypothetical protein